MCDDDGYRPPDLSLIGVIGIVLLAALCALAFVALRWLFFR